MKQVLLTGLTLIILSLFFFSQQILLKINESILGKLFFVLIIILYAQENTLYGLFIAIIFFVINEKFTYNYYENMVGNINNNNNTTTSDYNNFKLKHNNDMKIKPTTNGMVELSEQLKPSNPRKEQSKSTNKLNIVDDVDLLNLVSQQTSSFEPTISNLDETNLYVRE
jgi:hypothetical protein